MILTAALIAGLGAALLRAQIGRRRLVSPDLGLTGLVFLAFILQWPAFHWQETAGLIPDTPAAACLLGSQLLLLRFAWHNRRQPGFSLLAPGLALNFLVIALNGGLMPISPELAAQFSDTWAVGHRLGTGKDVVLPVGETWLWLLSDHFFLALPSYRVAYSPGDILIAGGAFRFAWFLGRPQSPEATGKASVRPRLTFKKQMP